MTTHLATDLSLRLSTRIGESGGAAAWDAEIAARSPFFSLDPSLWSAGVLSAFDDDATGRSFTAVSAGSIVNSIVNGHNVLRLGGTHRYLSDEAAADWAFMHTGGGYTEIGVIVPRDASAGTDRRLFSTKSATANATLGWSRGYITSSGVQRLHVGNGTIGVITNDRAGLTIGSPALTYTRHKTVNAPDWSNVVDGVATTGPNAAVPSSDPPTSTMQIGGHAAGNMCQCDIACWFVFADDLLGTEDFTAVYNTIATRFNFATI